VEIASHSSQFAFTKEFYLLDECVVSQGRASCHRTVRIPEWWEVWIRNSHNLHRVTKSVKMVMYCQEYVGYKWWTGGCGMVEVCRDEDDSRSHVLLGVALCKEFP